MTIRGPFRDAGKPRTQDPTCSSSVHLCLAALQGLQMRRPIRSQCAGPGVLEMSRKDMFQGSGREVGAERLVTECWNPSTKVPSVPGNRHLKLHSLLESC